MIKKLLITLLLIWIVGCDNTKQESNKCANKDGSVNDNIMKWVGPGPFGFNVLPCSNERE